MADPKEAKPASSARYPKRREAILVQAPSVFNRLGVRGATLADIASLFDLDITSIRYYFHHKDDLVAAAFIRSIEVHLGLVEQAKAFDTPEERVRALVSAYVGLRRRIRTGLQPDIMVFGDLKALSAPYSDEVWPRYADLFRAIRKIIADPKDVQDNRRQVNARSHLVVSQLLRSAFWLDNYEPHEFERVGTRVADILLNGLANPSTEWSPRVLEMPADADPDRSRADAFLLAATGLINEQGKAASLGRIAARLNLSKGAFYHHLEAKNDLVVACFDRTFRILADAQKIARKAGGTGFDQVVASLATLVRQQQISAGLLLHSALMSVDAETRQPLAAGIDKIAMRFADMIADGIVDGSIRPCDPRVAGQMVLSMVNSSGVLSRWVPGITEDTAVDSYVRPMVFGLFS